jgi:hypothetical protein
MKVHKMKTRRSNTSPVNQYCLEGYLLKVNELAYLVEIEMNQDKKAGDQENLPEWIFDSRHAIWLTVEDLPLKERATHGDRIREKLIESSSAP